jgi:hypothetical protein
MTDEEISQIINIEELPEAPHETPSDSLDTAAQ